MLSDSDLLVLENLTYCLDGNNAASANGLRPLCECSTVGEFLEQFSESILSQMDKRTGDTYGADSAAEWAAMIRYLKCNKEICNLKVLDVNNMGILFENPQDNTAIVAFRGTNGAEEWVDNVEGLIQADTKLQMEAYEYIESLDYDNITVVGHSKGGNKAQYVAIRSDKVNRCVAYDAQGFSQQFIDKYSVQIGENSWKVQCYSLSSDFVHILLYPLPGASFTFVDLGTDVTSFEQNHSANAIFTYYQDDNGYWHIAIDGNGNATLIDSQESSEMSLLHNLVTFIMNNASEQELQEFVNLIGPLLSGMMAEGWNSEQIGAYLAQHPEELATLISYVLHFVKLNNLTTKDLERLLNCFGIDMYEMLKSLTGISDKGILDSLIEKIFKFLTEDDRDEPLVEFLLKAFGDEGASIIALWHLIETNYNSIHPVNDSSNYQSKIRDYSKKNIYDIRKSNE